MLSRLISFRTGGPVVGNWTKFVEYMHEIGIPFFLGEKGPAELQGMGNYVLPVLASGGSDKVGGLLYCMDSFDQIKWYRDQSKAYTEANGGKPVPSFAFFHIPLPEYAEIKTYERTLGNRSENVYAGAVNSGMFSSMYEMGDVMGVFVGHDHNNDYVGLYGGITLAYGKATGVDTYGDNVKGGRVITMYEGQRHFDTWLRDEHGNKMDMFHYPSGISDEEIAKYDFRLSSDDGAVITIDGEIVVDLDGSHSLKHKSGAIRLEKGYHEFELRYFDDSAGQELAISVLSRRISGFEDGYM